MSPRARRSAWLALVAGLVSPLAAQDPAPVLLPPAWTAGYHGGLYARSADGRNEVVLEGLFQVDAVAFERSETRASEFVLRRFRPELAGRFDDWLRFRVEPNFQEEGSELEEAWVGAELGGRDTLLMVGRTKAPFGLEEVRSRRHIDFPRFSILNQFSPAEDHGAFVNGLAAGGRFEYCVAAYNGTGGADTSSSKDVAARCMVHPWRLDAASPLRNLQLGVAATVGTQDEELAGTALRNAFGGPVTTWAPGARLDGTRTRLGVELAWFHGPVMAQAEGLLVRQHMRQGATGDAVQFAGAYVGAGIVLTGEDKSFRGVDPRDPVGRGGSGAFVLAGRASLLDVDPALERFGLVDADTAPGAVRSLEVGLNWIPSRHVIVRCAYAHCFYEDAVQLGGGSIDDEGAVMVECQLHF